MIELIIFISGMGKEYYMEIEQEQEQKKENEKVEVKPTKADAIIGYVIFFTLIFGVIMMFRSCIQFINEPLPEQPQNKQAIESGHDAYVKRHVITKDTFDGQWAFTVDKVQVHNVNSDIPDVTGAKVIIDGKAYALTRNISNLEFLPDKFWKNGKTHIYEPTGEKVCNDILIDANTCKVSLADTINYIDKLEIEK